MKRLLLCLSIGLLLGCAAEHESIDELSSDRPRGAENFSESETQNVLIFNESSAFVSESEGNWKDGQREDGLWESYHKNGQLSSKGSYKDGKEDGLWEHYYDNGQLFLNANFEDGKEDGLWEYYYDNGQLLEKGNQKNGKQDGLWKYYNKDGTTRKTKNFKDGKFVE